MSDMMLKTPTAMDAVILPTPNAVEAEKYTKTYNKDSQMGRSLTALAVNGLLPTPLAVSVRHPGRVSQLRMAGDVTFCSRAVGETRPNGLEDWLEFHGLMPSPVAQDYRRRGPNSRQQGLPEVCHRLLHTPIADGKRPEADERGGLRGDVPGERRIPRFEGWEGFPTQPPVCRGDDGLPFGVADLSIPFGRWRREAIKALGNAWVPEVAYEIFRIIQMVEDGHDYD